ncbi:hypothetical protein SCHPADRAFT_318333 [Schizopora paradoxa]|uniref:Uncharacterized protein n=1 Tax=Schizopora paradoxa TaxID=27342 RepID=A0A0H2RRS9_9AGAM|nr:hypothetical protein SCHPADRAFT_318333 [Schizopora paradoxa]
MDHDGRRKTCLSARVQGAPGEMLSAEGTRRMPPMSSLFLKELREDDATTVYTYNSTWSTNYTTSNLPGPGRLLGNLFSRAGSSLEKHFGRVASRRSAKEDKEAVEMIRCSGLYNMFMREDPKDHERACEALLICAR